MGEPNISETPHTTSEEAANLPVSEESRVPGAAAATNKREGTLTLKASPLMDLQRRFAQLQAAVLGEPTFTVPADPQGAAPQQVDLETLLQTTQRSVDGVLALLSFVDALNRLGQRNDERSYVVLGEILPLATDDIRSRKKTGNPPPTPSETRLLTVYDNSRQARRPEWLRAVGGALVVVNRGRELPGPEVYLAYSPSLEKSSAPKRRELAALEQEICRMRNSRREGEGPTGEATLAAAEQRAKLIEELDRMLRTATDVDPKRVRECGATLHVELSARSEIVDTLLSVYSSLGKAIERLALRQDGGDQPFAIECAELTGAPLEGTSVRAIQKIARFSLDATPLLQGEERVRCLAFALKEYSRIQGALLQVYEEWQGQSLDADRKRREVMPKLERAMSGLFLGSPEQTRKIFEALEEMDEPALAPIMPALLTARVVESDARSKVVKSFLDQHENVRLLGQTLSHLVHGDEEAASRITTALQGGTLRPACQLGMRIRPLCQSRDGISLAHLFDDELKRISGATHSSFTEKTVLLHALAVVSEDEGIRRGLKGRLRNFDRVAPLVEMLLKDVRRENAPHAQFVESLRAKITRRFSPDLSNYWGQKELVREWRGLLVNHLKFLANRHAWSRIPPHHLFINGYLIYGDPGAGKSYLVPCMANDLGIPLVTISGMELTSVFEELNSAKTSEIETEIARFMGRKVEEAESIRRKCGALASKLFIDEMEAEFLRRDPATSPRAELKRTNVMLGVIEDLMKKHPEIIFVGATNHIGIVDLAARRPGRFGFHMEAKLPTQEDAEDIVRGVFESLEMSVSDEGRAGEDYRKLVGACVGTTPLAIQQGIDNAVVLARIDRGSNAPELDAELLRGALWMVELIKKHNFRGGYYKTPQGSDDALAG